MEKSFKLEKLYHRLLKPRGIPISGLPSLVTRLYEAGFIEVFHIVDNPDEERYTPTDKMTSRDHRDEFFKIVNQTKEYV